MTVYNLHGQEIYAVEVGSPNRQTAILIHGWSSSWYALSPLLQLLSLRFHCLAVDLPGYGQSPPLSGRITLPAYANVLTELIARVSNGPVVLVGHSMGGMVGITLALSQPALVERLVLIAPTITGRLSTYLNLVVTPVMLLERYGLGSLLVATAERAVVGISDRIMRPASFAERTGITEQDYERLWADARHPGQGRVRAECFFAMRENNLSGKLQAVSPPALVIWGAEDNTVPLRDAGIIADEWPEADLRILPRAGHWPQFEAPGTTRRLVAAYLGLPRFSDRLYVPVGDEELARVDDIAQFLAASDIGNNLNLAQRTRLAAQCQPRSYQPGDKIVGAREVGNELYIIRGGTVQVWSNRQDPTQETREVRLAATLQPGQITGELAVLDQGLRSADLVAGPEGARVLALDREHLIALCEDDSVLGTRLLWNIATAMSQRVRFILWQLQRAMQRAEAGETPKKREKR